MATKQIAFIGALMFLIVSCGSKRPGSINSLSNKEKPNVIIVMADDQGYGDLSLTGNPVLSTPNLDQLARESIRFTDFHVAPMCTPSRGQLLTGIDALRNGATAVCQGRSMIFEEIPLMPEYFQKSGYSTGIFGKWHLGDSYPHRPQDRGFEEVLSFPAWGISSLADHFGNSYFNPILRRNGLEKEYEGFCTDIFFEEAIKWIESKSKDGEPFFAYLPMNVPHVPELVEPRFAKRYKGKNHEGTILPSAFYGMISNLDENMRILDEFLSQQGLKENTILIYLSDNGTQNPKAAKVFNKNMRGRKTSMYEGGHRVPLFLRWPQGELGPSREIDALTQVQDILPTLYEFCQLNPIESDIDMNGNSLVELLRSQDQRTTRFSDRKLVIQYSFLESTSSKWDKSIVLWNKWRLVEGKELYDIGIDPAQVKNLIVDYPEVAQLMSDHFESWYDEAKPKYDARRIIHIGNDKSLETELVASDWDGGYCDNNYGLMDANKTGHWYIEVDTPGQYEFELRRWPDELNLPISNGIDSTFVKGLVKKGWFEWFGPRIFSEKAEVGKRPITSAEMSIGDFKDKTKVGVDDAKVIFQAKLDTGQTILSTLFRDINNDVVCSALYVKVSKLN